MLVEHPRHHITVVDLWLKSLPQSLDAPAYIDAFQSALTAMHAKVNKTLGEITLRAIIDRVVHVCSEEYPFLSLIRILPDGGARCDELRRQVSALLPDELQQGTRHVLIELLTVIGTLTAELLTVELHDALLTSVAPGDGAAARPTTLPRPRTPTLKDS